MSTSGTDRQLSRTCLTSGHPNTVVDRTGLSDAVLTSLEIRVESIKLYQCFIINIHTPLHSVVFFVNIAYRALAVAIQNKLRRSSATITSVQLIITSHHMHTDQMIADIDMEPLQGLKVKEVKHPICMHVLDHKVSLRRILSRGRRKNPRPIPSHPIPSRNIPQHDRYP